MKISLNWLKNYLSLEQEPAVLSQYLTDIGLEVEHLEKWEQVKGSLEGVVTGEVLTKIKHPEADRLSITTVNVGQTEPLQIVCGAPNVEVGQKVLVATVGTTLYPLNGEPLVIKKSKIRGVASEGMICAADELGLGSDHSGIMVLNKVTEIGQSAKSVLNLQEDWIFEIGLTPNRADAASHLGVARDLVAALAVKEGTELELQLPYHPYWKINSTSAPILVEVVDLDCCIRYSGIQVTKVKVKPSPEWLQNRLKAIGLKPINCLVDAGNFVMHELGQPLHIFDSKKIRGNQLKIQRMKSGTALGMTPKLTTLDGIERNVNEEDLVICDGQGPICFAGVFGGLDSGVSETTEEIFIESACFQPVDVRKTSKRQGLKTDASFRFERGTDPKMTVFALQRVTDLIIELTGGQIDSSLVDLYPHPVEPLKIGFSFKNCTQLCGIEIPTKTIKQIIVALGMEIISESTDALLIAIPPFKVDVKREVDVIEEVLRIYGYNAVSLSNTVKSTLSFSPSFSAEKTQVKISNTLASLGFNEIMMNSLTKSAYYGDAEFKAEDLVNVLNPLSSDLNVMRQTLLFGGLEAIAYNINRKNQDIKFYEFGKVYHKTGPATFKEKLELTIWVSGRIEKEQWNSKYGNTDFFNLKGVVAFVTEQLGLGHCEEMPIQLSFATDAIVGQLNKKEIFNLGKLNKTALKAFDIKQDVYFATFNWENCCTLLKNRSLQTQAISEFPSVKRDLALVLDQSVFFGEIEKLAYSTERKLLKQVQLMDVYEGEKIAQGKKSYAVRFLLQDEQETLTSNRIEKIMEKLLKNLQEKLGATLRA